MTRARGAAIKLLETYQGAGGELPPTDVGAIAELLELTISEHDDLRELPGAPQDLGPLSGMIDPPTRTIWVDGAEADRTPQRARFTIAHEIGHWQLHVGDQVDPLFDPTANVQEAASPRQLAKLEEEANSFARELLMPETVLRDQADQAGYDVAHLAGRFGVSVPAMRLSLQLLGDLPGWMRR